MANKENDVNRKIDYYSETANLLLEEEAYDIASDFFTLAGFYSLSIRDIDSAKNFSAKSLESCKKGKIQDHHYLFASSLKELCSGNLSKATDYWNKIKNKYTDDEVQLVEQILGGYQESIPQEKGEELLDTFLEMTHTKEEALPLDVFEEIAQETTQATPPTSEAPPEEKFTPPWIEEEQTSPIEKEVTPAPRITGTEPEEEWELVSQPLEPPPMTQPEKEPVFMEETEVETQTPPAPTPTAKPLIPPSTPLKPLTPPVTPPPPQKVPLSTPAPAVAPKPAPLEPPPATIKREPAPLAPPPATRVGGKNIYGRIKIRDIAWRVGKSDEELRAVLSNLINQGKIAGYIQGDEYIQAPDEALTMLSVPSYKTPPYATEKATQFFTTSEADISAQTREGYKRCGVCGSEIPEWTRICPKCGAKQ
ncbi:MAG: hypothetical protein KIH09_13200 [Candidatus Freyarchaeota archaeon]|nr:hypothetical protein [Candidatus Jordarchaeia archaeon]